MVESHRSISQAEYEAAVEAAHKPEKGKTLVETPAEDTNLIEELLGLPAGSFGKSYIKITGDVKGCPACNRQASFLEIIKEGTGFHGSDLIKDVVQGKRGFIFNPNPPRQPKCAGCGEPSPVAYTYYNCYHYYCY